MQQMNLKTTHELDFTPSQHKLRNKTLIVTIERDDTLSVCLSVSKISITKLVLSNQTKSSWVFLCV